MGQYLRSAFTISGVFAKAQPIHLTATKCQVMLVRATLPLGLTAVMMAGVTLITLLFVPETLPSDMRNSRFSLATTSPLSFIKLFRNGAGLSCAVTMQIVRVNALQLRRIVVLTFDVAFSCDRLTTAAMTHPSGTFRASIWSV